jgi:glucose/arabinose dehydrogenase
MSSGSYPPRLLLFRCVALLRLATLAFQAAAADPGTLLATLDPPQHPSAPGPTNIIMVSARTRTLLLTVDGNVFALSASNVAAVAAGYTHDAAIMQDGSVRQWPPTNQPPVPTDLTNVVALTAGDRFTCALQQDGRVVVWGRTTGATNVPPGLTNIVAIAAGRDHVLALTDTGRVIGWGFSTAANVPAAATNVAFIAAAGSSSVAATSNGMVWRWGQAYSGPPSTNLGRVLSQIAVTASNTYALDTHGNLLEIGPRPLIPWNVTNLAGIFTSDSTLYAIARGPVLRSQLFPRQYPPEVRSGGYGENLALGVTAESYHPFIYQWFFNGTPLSGANNSILRFTGLGTNHSGTYFAMVTNAFGTMTSAPITLNITVGCDEAPSQTFAVTNVTTPAASLTLPPVLPPGILYSTIPWGAQGGTSMAFAPDGRIFVCEQQGSIRIAGPGFRPPFATLLQQPPGGGENGLLGIAVDPGFHTNSFLYVYYTLPQPDFHNRISRLTANGNLVQPCSEQVLLEIEINFPFNTANHFAGALHFGPDGKLYAAVGDHFLGWREAPSLQAFAGKILRLNPDGTIPEDNPFYDATFGPWRAIWAKGLRNPFTFAIHHRTGRMLINDVGNRWEEINEGFPGADYGWPYEEGISETNLHTNPIYSYLTGSSTMGCASAIIGAAFYDPPRRLLPAEYVGSYFFGDFCQGWIRRLDTNGVVHNFATNLVGLTDIDVGPDGALYCLRGASIYRFTGAPARFLSTRYLGDGRVQLHVTAIPNQPYLLEASSDLVNWQPISTNQSTTAEFDIFDPLPPDTSQRFYRLRD